MSIPAASHKHKDGIKLRPAEKEDCSAVMQLLQELGYNHQIENFNQTYARILDEFGMEIVLATSMDAQVIGLISLRIFPVLRLNGLQVSIEELVVADQWRGRNIGTLLLDLALQRARSVGAVRLEILSSTGRESFKREFYQKNGLKMASSAVFRMSMLTGQQT